MCHESHIEQCLSEQLFELPRLTRTVKNSDEGCVAHVSSVTAPTNFDCHSRSDRVHLHACEEDELFGHGGCDLEDVSCDANDCTPQESECGSGFFGFSFIASPNFG